MISDRPTDDVILDHVPDENTYPRPKGIKEDTYYEGRAWQGGFNHAWPRNVKGQFPDMVKNVQSLIFTGAFRPKFIVLHNTGAPTLIQWMDTPGGQLQRLKNLEHYYKDQEHWSAGPHFFVSRDMIFEGTPVNRMGTHSPSWNDEAIGIEMAGNYDKEAFDASVQANTTYLIAVLHNLLKLGDPAKFTLGVCGLHFHKEDTETTHKNCPGKNVVKEKLLPVIQGKMKQLGNLQMPANRLGETHLTYDRLAEGPMSLEHEISTMGYEAGVSYPKLLPSLKGRTLRIGSYGSVVLLLQKLLRVLGYQMNATGYYGNATYASVRDFQSKHSLRPDGEVGNVTAAMIDSAISPGPTPIPTPTPTPTPNPPTPSPVDPPPPLEGGWTQKEVPFPA